MIEDGEVEINEPIAFNMEQEKLALQGTHNLYNSLAAGISANLAGIEKEYIRRALSDFKGVEHRLEKVATVRGVEFINDSKAKRKFLLVRPAEYEDEDRAYSGRKG